MAPCKKLSGPAIENLFGRIAGTFKARRAGEILPQTRPAAADKRRMIEGTVQVRISEYDSGAAPFVQAPMADPVIRVLVIEDDAEAAEMVRIRLTENGDGTFQFEWAQDLFQGLMRLTQPGIDVVLLDLGLPELSGYRSFRAIDAATERSLPVVIFTSDDTEVSRELTLGLGASGYLLKHASTSEDLKRALRDAARRKDRPESGL